MAQEGGATVNAAAVGSTMVVQPTTHPPLQAGAPAPQQAGAAAMQAAVQPVMQQPGQATMSEPSPWHWQGATGLQGQAPMHQNGQATMHQASQAPIPQVIQHVLPQQEQSGQMLMQPGGLPVATGMQHPNAGGVASPLQVPEAEVGNFSAATAAGQQQATAAGHPYQGMGAAGVASIEGPAAAAATPWPRQASGDDHEALTAMYQRSEQHPPLAP